MNRIDDLITRMRDIPGKEQRATQLQNMRIVRDKLKDAANHAETLRVQCNALSHIADAQFVEVAKQGLAKVASRAGALKKRHEEGAGFDRDRADRTLIHINEELERVSSNVRDGWHSLVRDQKRRYQPLVEAAERAALPGASGLKDAVARLDGWCERPPDSRKAAETYLGHVSSLPTAIASLGLEGRAGKFMVDASNGRAKAKDLHDPEVLAFLEAHPAVWSMLKIGL